jgi:hypothetical protein
VGGGSSLIRIDFTDCDGAIAGHERDWSSLFTADAGQEITAPRP